MSQHAIKSPSAMLGGGSVKPKGSFFDLEGDHVQRYAWVSQFLTKRSVLDVGCGYGYGSYFLAKNVAGKVLGIDADPKAITYATRNYRLGNLSFRLMDVCNMALANKAYDAAVSFEVIEHLTDVDSYLEGVSNG